MLRILSNPYRCDIIPIRRIITWKFGRITGYEGIYKISSLGRVKRVGKYRNQVKEWESNRILKPATKSKGYMYVQLSKNGKTSPKHIHRLVAEAFIPNPENKPTVNHKNGNKADNSLENLEWATYTENIHSIRILGNGNRIDAIKKPVLQYDLQGNFVAEYPSYREAQRQTGINSIDVVCRGERQKGRKQKTAGGYIWKYKEDVQD